MRAVYRKELRQYFRSPLGYVFLASFLAVSGYTFYSANLLSQRANLGAVFNSILVIVIFLIPVLTMRLYAEERKGHIDRLLLTSPVSVTGIALGKYLAALSVFGVGLVFTLPYVMLLLTYSHVGVWSLIGNYIAFSLVVAAFLSISCFLSSLTDSQVIAAVASYTVLIFLWMVGTMYTSVQNPVLRAVAERISFHKTYAEFASGLFNPASALYYLSVIAVFLLFTVLRMEKRRWS